MRIVAQHYKSGEISLLEVPAPACRPGGVLVRTECSLISTGTESMKVAESKLSLLGKARARPDQVRTVLQSFAQQGALATYRKVMNRLDSYTPLGYSCAGIVEKVGAGVDGFSVGQRVACGGNQFALHAEFNWVPVNLCVPVPNEVPAEHAAFTTVAAIAMQGFRQSDARLGETACVIGLGLIGQLLLQILRSAGVRVFGLDIGADRCELAVRLGATAAAVPDSPEYHAVLRQIQDLTDGAGCDHVFLTAGGSTNRPVEIAAHIARDRARIVDIGKCSLDLPWKEYYEKELDVRFSRSYGPGRYDPTYEEQGVDYPIGYVRWTERRNMQCVVDLLRTKAMDPAPLVTQTFPFEEATSVYERMNSGALRGLGFVFRYDAAAVPAQRIEASASIPSSSPRSAASRNGSRDARGTVRIATIGCGNFASGTLIPQLTVRSDVSMVEVVTQTSLSAANAMKKHGFARMSTDYRAMLASPDIDAVMVLTRHSSHARFAIEALRAGKAVFVEKPLALTEGELDEIVSVATETGNDRLMVGFNRRFSPLLTALKTEWGERVGPQVVQYRVNAGPVDPKSWYADSDGEGSRFAGEGGHFIDTVSWWLGLDPVEVTPMRTPDDRDNTVVTLGYPDGSIGVVTYSTTGDARYPKEMFEAFGQGMTAKLDNFARTELWRNGKRVARRALGAIDKGHRNELAAFVSAVRAGAPMPIALASLVATTRATIVGASGTNAQTDSDQFRQVGDPVTNGEVVDGLEPEPAS